MSIIDDQQAQERAARLERQRQAVAERQFRADVQQLMGTPAMRRVLGEFLDVTGVDRTAYRSEQAPMAHAVGWQDAGRWWLAAIREHCPEREPQLRAEANKAREGVTDEAEDADR